MTFLEKYEILKKSVPVPAASIGADTVDCEFVDHTYESTNCFFSLDGFFLKDSIYTNFVGLGNRLVDCDSVVESEKCYECIDSHKCHDCTYLIDCNSCTDCHFSAFLNSCSDCFGCVGLTHKKYCIFNKQYTKDEYFKQIEELRKEKAGSIYSRMLALKKNIPHPASHQSGTENCPYGDYIYSSKNCFWVFNIYYSENSGYMYKGGTTKNCWDFFFAGGNPQKMIISERCYQMVYSEACYNSAFLVECNYCSYCYYSMDLLHCTDCFGCVGLRNKKYCILNNQLTKGQYEKAVKEIRKELGWRVEG